MGTVHLIGGFNVSDGGAATIDTLRPHFESRDFSVVDHDHQWSSGLIRDLISVRFGNRKRAERLAQHMQPDDILVGHSNGCAVIMLACWMYAQLMPEHRVRCVFLNPALDKDSAISPIVGNVLCLHTRSDRIVWISKFLLWHRWGEAGRVGLTDARGDVVTNLAYETLELHDMGHSGVFRDEKSIHRVMDAFDDWSGELDFQSIV